MTDETTELGECLSCRKRAGAYACVSCADAVCKPCSEKVSDPLFASLEAIPNEQVEGRFCGRCWDAEMAARLEAFQSTLEAAKQVFVFFTTQKKHIPLIRKSKTPVNVESCPDRDETILRLAYVAAKEEYNAVVDVEVTVKKVRAGGSNKTADWKGTGFPALVDGKKVDLQDSREQIYR
ncbi:MAG: hypothetical protein JST04_01880 [Bdellovibrionales bacterium]|nr:hypothetical protein [Bdellovibrionales bacterium]